MNERRCIVNELMNRSVKPEFLIYNLNVKEEGTKVL